MTNGNDPIVQTVYRQIGKDNYRPATQKEVAEGIYLVHKEGLTKREYFAAMAMQGICANMAGSKSAENQAISVGVTLSTAMAVYAVEIADAIIAELNRNEK